MTTLLKDLKNSLKEKISNGYQNHGQLCANHPLPMIVGCVLVVVICSLPIRHPVFERTTTFLFGRIKLENYRTNVSVCHPCTDADVIAFVQQISFSVNLTETKKKKQSVNKWDAFQQALRRTGLTEPSAGQIKQRNLSWTSTCIQVSRKSFLKSPHSRLIYPRGRFHKQLKQWYPKQGCLLNSPKLLLGLEERIFNDFPDSFKELVLGIPHNMTGLISDVNSYQFEFLITFFLKSRDIRLLKYTMQRLQSSNYTIVNEPTNHMYKVTYFQVEDEAVVDLFPLSITYLLVFIYLLFSVAKMDTLISRWGLAFSAVMTIILSLSMSVGLCASLDLLPATLTISEIFPYIVMVIGLENVLIITKSVLTTSADLDVSARVANGMKVEGWYMTKNIVAELTIFAGGYFTAIPSIQDFCKFAFVGVLSDFFLQLTFFAPILAVDIRRRDLIELDTITIQQEFAVGFNLRDRESLPKIVVQPAEIASRRLYFAYLWARSRIVQRAFMVGCVLYISYAVYQTIQEQKKKLKDTVDIQNYPAGFAENSSPTVAVKHPLKPPKPPDRSMYDEALRMNKANEQKSLIHDGGIKYLKDDELHRANGFRSWLFLRRHHWPELFAFYHISFNKRSIVILPQINITVSGELESSKVNPTKASIRFKGFHNINEFLILASLFITIGGVASLLWIVCWCPLRKKLRNHPADDIDRLKTERAVCRGHSHNIEFVVSDGLYVISACLGGAVRVWDPNSGACILIINRSTREVIDPDDVSSSSRRKKSIRRDIDTSRELASSIWSLDAKNGILVIGCADASLEVYSIKQRRLIAVSVEEGEGITAVKLSSRITVAVGRLNGILDIIEILYPLNELHLEDKALGGMLLKHRIRAHRGAIKKIDILIGYALTSSSDRNIKIYLIDDGSCHSIIPPSGVQVTAIHVCKSINMSAVTGSENGSLKSFSVINPTKPPIFETRVHKETIISIGSHDRRIASLSNDGTICVWNEAGELMNTMEQIARNAFSLRFLGQRSMTVVTQGSIILLNPKDGTLYGNVRFQEGELRIRSLNLVCFVDQCSLAIACGRVVELMRFPNIVDKDE